MAAFPRNAANGHNGTLTVAENPAVSVTEYEKGVKEYVIATADAIEGRDDFASATFSGCLRPSVSACDRVKGA